MKATSTRPLLRPVLAALGAAPLLLATPAGAAGQTPKDVRFAYDPPVISADGSHISWHWTLENKGTGAMTSVILLQRLEPALDGVKASPPCEVVKTLIRCRYASIPPGGRLQGTLDADLTSALTGAVQISGQITWQPGIGGPRSGPAQEAMPAQGGKPALPAPAAGVQAAGRGGTTG